VKNTIQAIHMLRCSVVSICDIFFASAVAKNLSGLRGYASIGVAKLRAHRTVINALAFRALIRIDGVDLVDVADGTVGTLGLAGTAGLAEFRNDFVSHDALSL
jgi:hypothetical protein